MIKESKRLRIAILGSRGIPARYGGYETVVQELSTGLAKEGFEVYVSCESRGLKMKPFGTYKGVRLIYFPVISAIRNVSEVLTYDMLSVFWATFRADIIYMVGEASILTLIFPRLLRKKVIVNVDGLESSRRQFNPLLRFLLRFVETVAKKIANYIVVDSYAMAAIYSQIRNVTPIYIPNGIREIKPLDNETMRSFNIKKGEYYLVIARLIPDNNIDLIIEGFSGVNSRKKLAIVGPLDKSDYVTSLLSRKNEKILFLGGIYDQRLQRTLRHNCFAYIHGHEKGGTNPSLVEALSCRNVILALDVVFNREVAEKSALYFKKDPDDLKKKIELLEGNWERTRLMKDAYTVYKRKYTVEIMLGAFTRFISDIEGIRPTSKCPNKK
jgi:rhamnosyltransferase